MSVFSKNSKNSNEEYIEYSLTYSDGSKYTGDVIIFNIIIAKLTVEIY